MSLASIDLLRNAVFAPESLPALVPTDWDLLIRQARHAGLLARIHSICRNHDLLDRIPAAPRMHLESAANMAKRQRRELVWETEQIVAALHPLDLPVVILKGAAYVMAGLDVAEGRLVSDVDILVPHAAIGDVETVLMKQGWAATSHSQYDQRYYRTWMHEIPPLRHIQRGTVVDVHHAILPNSARLHPDSAKLFEKAITVPGKPHIRVLTPEDMVIHSATHLFHEGELERGLRDLVDIDNLLREFGGNQTVGFWERLVPRACELDLSRPLFYALRYANLMIGSAIPNEVLRAARNAPGGRQDGAMLAFMDALFLRALRPAHASTSDRYTPLARWLLYIRSHWIRMPPWLLLPHLTRKTVRRLRGDEEA